VDSKKPVKQQDLADDSKKSLPLENNNCFPKRIVDLSSISHKSSSTKKQCSKITVETGPEKVDSAFKETVGPQKSLADLSSDSHKSSTAKKHGAKTTVETSAKSVDCVPKETTSPQKSLSKKGGKTTPTGSSTQTGSSKPPVAEGTPDSRKSV